MQVAVVTGASSGIGAELVRRLQADHWHVVGLSRRPSQADEHEECDVADRAAVDAVAARVLERHPQIDLLVNNAGVGARGNYLDADPEVIERVIRVNYLGSVWSTLAFLPGLGQGSHVVNVVSVAGTVRRRPVLGVEARAARVLALARGRARAARHLGHTVNPGFVETEGFPQRERFGPLVSRIVVDPPLVVQRLLEAVDKDKREIFVPRWYRAVAWAQALAPGSVTSGRRSRSRLSRYQPTTAS